MSKVKSLLTIVVLLLFTFVLPVLAQTSKGTIVGTILDQNGAAVTGATIKLSNVETGVSRESTTSAEGTYRFEAVDPGNYKIDVTAGGFRGTTIQNVKSAGAQTSNYPISLEVGNPSEMVQVTSDTVILQTQDGARVDTIDKRQITDLPVAGLNPVNLVFTLPGVVNPGPLAGGFVQGTEFSINGLRARANNQLIDGLDNNDNSIAGQFYQPVLRDGYNEVTVLGSDYSAEYGRAGGAVVNVITRSGTNAFHGSVYDVISTSALSALSPFEKAGLSLTKKPVTIENDYGLSIGGPLNFPRFGEGGSRFYNGRNKIFFFFTFQSSPFRSGAALSSPVVPTAEGFATLRSLFPVGASTNLDRYLATIGSLRGTTGIRPIPLGGGRADIPFGTATRTTPQPVDDKQYLARVDWTPNSKDSIAFRYLADKQAFSNQFPQFTTLQFDGTEIDVPSFIQGAYINFTRNFSTNTTNEFRLGYGRFNLLFAPRDASLTTSGPQFTFGGSASTVTGVGLDPTFPQGRIFNNYQFQDTITHTMGNHTVRAGVDINVQRAKQFVPINTRGTLVFSNGGGFPAFGNFIDNFSGTAGTFASKVFGTNTDFPNIKNQAYFVNDSWRARPNLTFNLGLRYELFGRAANVAPFPAFAGFNAPFPTRAEQKRDTNNFGPRFSFAYTPLFGKRFFGEDKTVIRGGFSVNYDVFFNNILSNLTASSPNAIAVTTRGATAGGRGFANASNTLPAVAPAPNPFATQSTIDPNLVNPKTLVWNFGVQRELPGHIIVDAAYVGSRGIHLFLNEELNPVDPATGLRVNANFGAVQPRTNAGDSIYHSLQTRVERGIRRGLLFRFSYTYSKAIDDVNSEVFVTSGGSSRGSDPFSLVGGRRADRSVATYDVPHAAVFSFLYDIPSPVESGIGKTLLGGFTLSGIYRIQSGAVETPYLFGFDINGDGNATNDRPAINNPGAPPNSVAISNDINGTSSPTGYSDANGNDISLANARYVVDSNIRTGIAGRNTLRAPNLQRLDLSLNRAIRLPFAENHKLDIRVEFFNVLNRPIFTWDAVTNGGLSDGDVFNPFFNQPRLNGGPTTPNSFGTSRSGRIQVRYSF